MVAVTAAAFESNSPQSETLQALALGRAIAASAKSMGRRTSRILRVLYAWLPQNQKRCIPIAKVRNWLASNYVVSVASSLLLPSNTKAAHMVLSMSAALMSLGFSVPGCRHHRSC